MTENEEVKLFDVLPSPIKGNSDWRDYRAIKLQNGVTCLLVHDKESKTTSTSCCVNVGASSDPRSLSGLAHFCEHMCFLGSEKYPGENEYKSYLSAHGGRSNASTSMHLTNYKFEVLADHAEKAVDIFSNFFISPLFTASGTAREVQAVDSENSKNLTSDGRRRLQILKDIGNIEHYYTKFSTGNDQTIPTNDPTKLNHVRDSLLAFHRKHYTPQNMFVTIAGPQSLDTLQEWIVPRFSSIEAKSPFPTSVDDMTDVERQVDEAAKDAPPFTFEQPRAPFHSPFQPSIMMKSNGESQVGEEGSSWPVLLTTKPLRPLRKLVLLFPMPSDQRLPNRSPASFMSHLLGHEGIGSAFSALQNNAMISSLSAGARTRAPDFTLFQVDMELTPKGEEHWKEVADVIFAYCRLVTEKAKEAKEGKGGTNNGEISVELNRIWGEVCQLERIFFHQTSPSGVYSYVPKLSERIVMYGTEACLSAGYMLNENETTFPLDDVIETLQLLVPSNCILERCSETAWNEAVQQTENTEQSNDVSDNVFGKRIEKWYGVDYYLSPIDRDIAQAWNGSTNLAFSNGMDLKQLNLPRANRYIPRSLELCSDLPDEAKKGPRIEREIDPPKLIINTKEGHLYHRLDDRYALPQSSITFVVRNGAVNFSKTSNDAGSNGQWEFDQKKAILSSMMSGTFRAALAQDTYDADLAGLYWSLSLGSAGIKLSCFGYSDRLPDLALKVLGDFLSGDYLQATYFDSAKDRAVRGYRTFFQSRRADSHAVYYRDALITSRDTGVEDSLALAEAATLDAAVEHHKNILRDNETFINCLFTGNVSEDEAKKFFLEAKEKVKKAREQSLPSGAVATGSKSSIPAGFLERRLPPGEDIELHFESKNPEEENGATIFTYQSAIPAFKGEGISHANSLKSSSSISLISHMLKEPLFNELRTKQQLGYIVSSYYEIGYSSRGINDHPTLGPMTVPVDFLTIAVLSRKLPPTEIATRIDDFLDSFRESLQKMPNSEIQSHANALSSKFYLLFCSYLIMELHPNTALYSRRDRKVMIVNSGLNIFSLFDYYYSSNEAKLLKPIQKLSTEADSHFGKIHRYGPEVYDKGGKSEDLPWDSVKSLAATVQSLERSDLLDTWDRMILPANRSRIVSCVYGKTFPLQTISNPQEGSLGLFSSSTRVINNFDDLLKLRGGLETFDETASKKRGIGSRFLDPLAHRIDMTGATAASRRNRMIAIGIGLLGIGVVSLTCASRNKKLGWK